MAAQEALKDNGIVGPLVKLSKTLDQVKVVMDVMSLIVFEKEKAFNTTVFVTAGRGRGKSAAMGLIIAGAIIHGNFRNIMVTAPFPENVQAFFQFMLLGLQQFGGKIINSSKTKGDPFGEFTSVQFKQASKLNDNLAIEITVNQKEVSESSRKVIVGLIVTVKRFMGNPASPKPASPTSSGSNPALNPKSFESCTRCVVQYVTPTQVVGLSGAAASAVSNDFESPYNEEGLEADRTTMVNSPTITTTTTTTTSNESLGSRNSLEVSHGVILQQAEILVIDEAAAIPLPIVNRLLGPYLVLMASTIGGYEGTGRSLTLKLVQKLRAENSSNKLDSSVAEEAMSASSTKKKILEAARDDYVASESRASPGSRRYLLELRLQEPIRYSNNDPVEKWLNSVLCMDSNLSCLTTPTKESCSCPHPDQCELYYVNRDTLFSYHDVAEELLQRIMALLVAGHYRNQPDDLQLLSDAPAHHLFILVPKVNHSSSSSSNNSNGSSKMGESTLEIKSATTTIPEILCVIQVCEEGAMSGTVMEQNLKKGLRPRGGDLVPYTLSQQFQAPDFASLLGMRVVRIAVNPAHQRLKYGSKALQLLIQFFEAINIRQQGMRSPRPTKVSTSTPSSTTGIVDPPMQSKQQQRWELPPLQKRENLPFLLVPTTTATTTATQSAAATEACEICKLECAVDYLSTAFGVTLPLYEFWKKNGLSAVYLRQQCNDLTAEHSMIMIRPLHKAASSSEGEEALAGSKSEVQPSDSAPWFARFAEGFHFRLLSLLSTPAFADIPLELALSMVLHQLPLPRNPSATVGGSSSSSNNKKQFDSVRNRYTVDGVPQLTCYDDLELLGFNQDAILRLSAFSRMLVDVQVVMDLFPTIASIYFGKRLMIAPDGSTGVILSVTQSAVLLALGLQRSSLKALVTGTLHLQMTQVMTLLYQITRAIYSFFHEKLVLPRKRTVVVESETHGSSETKESLSIKPSKKRSKTD